MASIRALIFDMDGTMVHNEHLHEAAWSRWFTEQGMSVDAGAFNRAVTGLHNPDIFARFFPQIPGSEVPRHSARKEALYRELLADGLEPVPGLKAFIAAAAARGLPMAVASSAPGENVDAVVDGLGLRDVFVALVHTSTGLPGKPAPDMFLSAAAAMGCTPDETLVFEDSHVGLEAARRAGMRAVAMTTSLTPAEIAPLRHVVATAADFTTLSLDALGA